MRDDIGLAQEAAKRRERIFLLLLIPAVVAIFLYGMRHHDENLRHHEEASEGREFLFADRTLQFPATWHRYDAGSNAQTVVLMRTDPTPFAPTIALDDERTHPELPDQFVNGWKHAEKPTDGTTQNVDSYYDASVNAAGAVCVRIDGSGSRRPLKIVCLSSDGQWKLTMVGSLSDIPAMDLIAEQLPVLERR